MAFKTKFFGGYDPRDVDEQFRKLEQELAISKDSRMKLESELKEKNDALASMSSQLEALSQERQMILDQSAASQRTNEEIARLALKEASGLIEKAKGNANLILQDSMIYVKGLDQEIADFKASAKEFRAQILKMSEDLLQTIDNSEIFSLINEEENTKIETGQKEDL